jgi:shikimate kinase
MASNEPTIVTLAGMMGSGKTTVRDLLARELDADAHDLDTRIPAESGRSIPELFAQGEASFREAEHGALQRLLDQCRAARRSQVIALGGGALAYPPTRALAFSAGPSVYLRCGLRVLFERLSQPGQRAGRPLLAAEDWQERLAGLLDDRAAVYEQCSIVVDAEGPPETIVQSIVSALGAREH